MCISRLATDRSNIATSCAVKTKLDRRPITGCRYFSGVCLKFPIWKGLYNITLGNKQQTESLEKQGEAKEDEKKALKKW